MKAAILLLLCGLVISPAAPRAQNAAKPATPETWLKQLSGVWEAKSEMTMSPGGAKMTSTSTERVRIVGAWMIAEHGIQMAGTPMTGIMTVCFDPDKKKFVGTWIDSMSTYMWNYEGSLDASGKKLTLEAEGPNPMAAGKMSKFRDAIEIRGKDHKVFTSSILGDDGKWFTFQTSLSQRKK